MELGAHREADTNLRALEAAPDTPDSLRELAAALRERMDREAARLRVERAPELADTRVALDEVPLSQEALDEDVYVEPGPHVVEATRGARSVARVSIRAEAGERTRVYLGVGAAPEVVEADPVVTPTATPLHEEWGFWAAIGGGVLLVVGIVIVAIAVGGGSTDPVRGNFEPGVLSWP